MVITLNIPRIPGEGERTDDEEIDFENGRFGRAVEEGRRTVEEFCQTLQVKDWGLIGEEKEGA